MSTTRLTASEAEEILQGYIDSDTLTDTKLLELASMVDIAQASGVTPSVTVLYSGNIDKGKVPGSLLKVRRGVTPLATRPKRNKGRPAV